MIYHGDPHPDSDRYSDRYDSDRYDLVDLREEVDQAVDDLGLRAHEFDSIVVSGMSGVVVGSPVSLALGKPLVIIRKPDDVSHHQAGSVINAGKLGGRSLFLDDFISGGYTRDRVVEEVEQWGGVVVALYLYRDHDYRPTSRGPAR